MLRQCYHNSVALCLGVLGATSQVRYALTMPDTIFSKILRGQIPCHRVYEDADVLAFLDVAPLCLGHTLLIPKESAATLDALSEQAASAVGRVLPRLCRVVMQVSGCNAYNILQNNGAQAHQAVMHVHFHIIPKTAEQGLGIGWLPGTLDHIEAAVLAKRMAGLLSRDEGQAE